MTKAFWGLAGLWLAIGLAMTTGGGTSAYAAAPQTQFERAKTQATIAFRKYYNNQQAAPAPGKDPEETANLREQYERALSRAVALDPVVRRTERNYQRAVDKNLEEAPYLWENVQIATQNSRTDIESEIYARVVGTEDDDDVSAPVKPAGSWDAELLMYGGALSTESFGSTFRTGLFGGRADVGFRLTERLRLQLNIEGEATGSYCGACNGRSHVTYGGHLDWQLTPRIDAGVFGGLQNGQPTFAAPSDTSYFVGAEARYNTRSWMVGAQVGYFDVANGPGTLVDAWFIEGRTKIALGDAFARAAGGWPYRFNPVLGLSVGHASGKLSTTSVSANSTYWSVTLSHRIANTPVTGFVGFQHYTNRVETVGTVWDENLIKGGFRVNFWSDLPSQAIEQSQQTPYVPSVRLAY